VAWYDIQPMCAAGVSRRIVWSVASAAVTVACHRGAPSGAKRTSAVQSTSTSAASVSRVAVGTEPPQAGPPWWKFDKSRCTALAPPPSPTNALFAASRQLRDRAELDALVVEAITGAPQRIGLQVEGTFRAGCDCPPFHAWFSAPGESFASIVTIERKGVPRVLFGTNLSFILVGYFSGAYVNEYEKFRVFGEDPGTPDEEERVWWPDREPEFCVEAICYSFPEWKPDPELGKRDEYTPLLRKTSADHAKEMGNLGMLKCKREWAMQ